MKKHAFTGLLLSLLLSFQIVFASNGDIPSWLIQQYRILGLDHSASLAQAQTAYEEKLKKLSDDFAKSEVVDLNAHKRDKRNLESALNSIKEFVKEQEEQAKLKNNFHFDNFSDRWIKEITPANIEDYLDITWKQLEPRVSSAFSTYVETPADFDFDMGMSSRRINPKLMNQKNHYIDYNYIANQFTTLKTQLKSAEEVDLFRKVVLIQIYAKKAFDEEFIQEIFLNRKPMAISFLNVSADMLLESKYNFTLNNEMLNDRKLEKEFKKLNIMSKNENVSLLFSLAEKVKSSMQFYEHGFLFNETTHYIYQAFMREAFYIINKKNSFQTEAWETMFQVLSSTSTRKGLGFKYTVQGIFSNHINKIKTQDDLNFFDALLWRYVSIVNNLEAQDIMNIEYKDIQKIHSINELVTYKSEFLSSLSKIDDDIIQKIISSDQIDFILKSIDNLIKKGCNNLLDDLI